MGGWSCGVTGTCCVDFWFQLMDFSTGLDPFSLTRIERIIFAPMARSVFYGFWVLVMNGPGLHIL